MSTAKTERNNHIKQLWASGNYTQEAIAQQFSLTQSRVNSILYDRRPLNRYCHYCGDKTPPTISVCIPCRTKRTEQRQQEKLKRTQHLEAIKTAKAEQRALLMEERRAQKAAIRSQREQVRIDARKAIYEKIYAKQEQRQLRYEQLVNEKVTEVPLLKDMFVFPWQKEGRERVRFYVRKRDKFTCQDCGAVRTPEEVAEYNKTHKPHMKNHDVHHLEGLCGKKSKGYDKVEDMHLLITLCHKCHMSKHASRNPHRWVLKGKEAEMRELIRQGMNQRQVADVYGVTAAAVSNYLRKNKNHPSI